MQLFRSLQGYPGEKLMVMGPAPESDAQILPCRYETNRLLIYRLRCTRFGEWVTGVNSLNVLPELGLSRSTRIAREFAPDLVVTVMDHLSYYKHAWALSRRLKAGLVTITMDDPQAFEQAHPWLERAYVRFLKRLYGDAVLSLGVSREMCDYLQLRFGKPSTVFHFGPSDGMRSRDAKESGSLQSPGTLTLGYAGAMSLGYHDGILAILPALEQTGAKLVVYTRDQGFLVRHPQVVNRGFLPPDALWSTLQSECDAVLLPYSFKDDVARIYRTHFPTKLSEYCWVGMPMLLIGPAYATGIRWGLDHPDAALTATSPDPVAVAPILEQLRTNPALRIALAANGAETARLEFDPEKIRERFALHLREAAAVHHRSMNNHGCRVRAEPGA
jgi:glycosyltransferase involved in cell wall biosynthesis